MRRLVLSMVVILAAACGENGPGTDGFESLWQLTSVNAQPLPAPGDATGGEIWLSAVLQFSGEGGSFDSCMESPSTSARVSRSTYIVVHPIGGDKAEVSYFDRRTTVPDTVSLNGDRLTLRHRNSAIGQEGLDVLTFVSLTGPAPEVCALAP
jgi:hypothetical protein